MKTLRKALLALPLIVSTQAHADSEPLFGEIMWTAFAYCPVDWVMADGRSINVNDNQALASLLGIQFGGSWPKTFAVPDLRGATAVGQGQKQGQNFVAGQYRQGPGCPQGQQCPTNGTPSLTLTPCIAVNGYWPQRP
jgi:microcystin-dependent protein